MSEETAVRREFLLQKGRFVMAKDKALSEREIIILVKRGNKEAYQAIVERYMKRAYYIALGFVRNPQDALDISQEAFIKAFRRIKSFDIERPFFPWFYKLMKNFCLDHLKRRSRIQEVPLEESRVLKEEHEDREMKEVLWKGIESLPVEQRETIILRYFQQLSYQEISEITGKPVGTVMSSLFYAKKRLKETIKKYLNLGG
ncbi:MAG: sigma-70 family RNA polymerase sigma factor [Candidatus Aminicenantes bacterium]|nr:sigma-70 family RNA polymerase sigma factor [Candidatus Aminicenantes bacterium]MDH5466506.1 sigma-70 family RNA polymerase sigma factor [Candidatus Aminicenantes bacterium]MDH5704397.1 sigma-70 family RNA polymerase sigma factor [Candidatus Aminicenantes bacterium]